MTVRHSVADPLANRAKADYWKNVFVTENQGTEANTKWNPRRIMAFMFYCDHLNDCLREVTLEDRKFLRQIGDVEDELAVIRGSALALRASIKVLITYRFDKAMERAKDVVRVTDSASEQEWQLKVRMDEGIHVSLSKVLHKLHAESAWQIMKMPKVNRLLCITPDGTENDVSLVGGKHCDGCGNTCNELGLQELNECSRCGMTYYCSKECQVRHWKHGGHCKACRCKGEFHPGDCAVSDKFGVVRIVGFVQDNHGEAGRFVTCSLDEKFTFGLPASKLRNMRPALWTTTSKSDKGKITYKIPSDCQQSMSWAVTKRPVASV